MQKDTDNLRYPAGKYKVPATIDRATVNKWIAELEELPQLLRKAVAGLNDSQLDTPYREGGWTVRQVVHHIGDSHMNSFIRFKWALTEENPVIKPYDENLWARTGDYKTLEIEDSLKFTEYLHKKIVVLLRTLNETDLKRILTHPEHGRSFTIDYLIGSYAWHGRHHVAHITSLRERMGW